MKAVQKKLFGTDGIRGTANEFPMTLEVITRVGQALGYLLKAPPKELLMGRPKVVIGKDTRLSGYMVEMALASGLNSMGVDVQLVGPLPTPGIGFLTRNMRATAGIVISASHNPFQDNGIKIFGDDGFKISGEMEAEIERWVSEEDMTSLLPKSENIGRSKRIEDSAGRYIVYVKNTFPLSQTLDGLRIVLDCANGAAYKVGPAILQELGAETIVIGNQPNGTNVNDKCGALYPAQLQQAVLNYRADLGISLDGDADRVILVDETGAIVNGDHVLAICGIHLKKQGRLKHDTVVSTQMCNFGLDQVLKKNGIRLVKTDVGDKYVVEEMRKQGYVLGGESSGHIIFLEHSTTGDGLIAALNVLSVIKETGQTLSQLRAIMKDVPQVLRNVRVQRRENLDQLAGYKQFFEEREKSLNGEGRIFIRYSGTEPLIRVLVEGTDQKKISQLAEEFANYFQKHLS